VNILRRQREAAERLDEHWQPRLYARWIAVALVVAYGIAFILENGRHVSVHFVFKSTRVSLVWVILLSVALGLILGIALSQIDRRRRRARSEQ